MAKVPVYTAPFLGPRLHCALLGYPVLSSCSRLPPYALPPLSLLASQLSIMVRLFLLTLLALFRNPWVFGHLVSLLFFATHISILTSDRYYAFSPKTLSFFTERSTTYPLSSRFLGTAASVILLASFIFDAIDLIQCVATRSLSGGCFQAYCLPVLDLSLSFSLRGCLRPYRSVWAVSLLTNSTSLLLLDSCSSRFSRS